SVLPLSLAPPALQAARAPTIANAARPAIATVFGDFIVQFFRCCVVRMWCGSAAAWCGPRPRRSGGSVEPGRGVWGQHPVDERGAREEEAVVVGQRHRRGCDGG